jgi:hyperosmotically inducible protein
MKISRNIGGTILLASLVAVPMAARATPGQETVAHKTADAADKTKDAIVQGAKTVGNKTKDGVSKTGEVMTDAWVTTRVHGRFVDVDLLKDSDIKVDSSKHVVTLTGTVMTRAGRTKASSVALGTEGVHRVVNKLTIGPKR